MEFLEQEIIKSGKVLPGNVLKVDGFINHQLDAQILYTLGKECKEHFDGKNVTKILTIEASGIALASFVAYHMGVKALFAKKSQTSNQSKDVYTTRVMSYTHNKVYDIFVAKQYLSKDDKVVIVDDFLAKGEAVNGLMRLVMEAGAEVVGVCIAVEKGFQGGGDQLRREGVDLLSFAIVDEMTDDGKIKFRKA